MGFVSQGVINLRTVWGALAIVSMAACVFHGFKRHNGSIGWGLGWGLFGTIAPVVGPVIAVAQGFARPERKAG